MDTVAILINGEIIIFTLVEIPKIPEIFEKPNCILSTGVS